MRKFNFTIFIVIMLVCSAVSSTSIAKVIKEERSLYRNIYVEDIDNQRCLKFSVKRRTSSQSCIYKDNKDKLVFDYTKFVMSALVFAEEPKHVLIIGLGGGTLSNSLLKLYPDTEIDNVEIDPAVVKVAKDYFSFTTSEKVKVHTQDGRIFIKRALNKSKRYDLIILDAFNGEYIPEHLLTQEFLQEAQTLLTADGIVVANTFSSSSLYHHESATYHEVFGDFYTLVNNNFVGNRIIIANARLLTDKEINQRVNHLEPKLSKFDIALEQIIKNLTLEQNSASEYRVLTDQYSPANLL